MPKTTKTKKTVAKKVEKPLNASGFPPPTDIVIVFYLNVSGYTPVEASTAIISVRDEMRKVLGFAANLLVLPIYNSDTRIECINPVLLDSSEFKRVKEVIDRAEEAIETVLATTALGMLQHLPKITDVN